ncbi:unnamed protein product [Linum tenue]|uniref:Uncharacterized protein n=1 Tax=Linum tenue TaxID=586396 RepID=A0AAV0NK38_9ROSI|nr:unnamed protein product [Linum tenue]CAI0552585.1 unnamed protein product [Linum tenue]
MCRHAPLLA